jgi:predicted dehydrogenase
MSSIIRWGILGCGRIARKFADDLKLVEGAQLVAAGSRNLEIAQNFAEEFPVKYIHGSYEALAGNPEVDVIYIATPHAFHHEHALLCLENNKAVLCEKAFALNALQAKEMIDMARKRRVFLMEAMWTKFVPHFNKVLEMINEGRLGQVQSVLANFGFHPVDPVPQRLYDPALGGGTMLDIGIYNVFLALSVLGAPDEIDAWMTPAPSGVDAQCAVVFRYRNGALAQLFSSFTSNMATDADISGNKGRIRLTTRFYEPSTTVEYYPGRVDSREIIPVHRAPGWGYHYEARHVGECLKNGLTESPVMTHADTMLLMEVLDEIRRKAGIKYNVD